MKVKRRALIVVMDGVGVRESDYGNAVKLARTPYLNWLKQNSLYTTLKAHGTYVGLPSDQDMGNSEVGHNALGAGRVYDQGAKLVAKAVASGSLFKGAVWQKLMGTIISHKSTLHLISLLSDGNVHSHQNHLHALMRQAKSEGVGVVRLHILLDGRDVGEKSAEIYINRLLEEISQLRSPDFDVRVASGGGRMTTTMDRYEADWSVVEKGWQAHVLGQADYRFPSVDAAIKHFRAEFQTTDQYLPSFVIETDGEPIGVMQDHDGVVFCNFRGDRSIEISQAFDEDNFSKFDRQRRPKVFYAGMMEYDGDRHIPRHYLVSPPAIDGTLGEHLAGLGLKQFACSETQKFGHVTYFWNGNRSGYFDQNTEEYLEIPSDRLAFDLKPWMKACEITDATVDRIHRSSFHVARINYANGDMVGHTGNLEASIVAVGAVDLQIGRLLQACRDTDTLLLVTADHGNCDEMFDTKEPGEANWFQTLGPNRPRAKTSHSLNEVPFYLYDPRGESFALEVENGTLANIPATILEVCGLKPNQDFLPSLVKRLK